MVDQEKVKDIIKDVHNISTGKVNELYKLYLGKTNIERYKLESLAINLLIKGEPKKSILNQLKQACPEGSFTYDDLERFIERNDEIVGFLLEDNRRLALRHFKAQEDCLEELSALALFTRSFIKDLKDEKDNANLNAAIRTLSQLVMNVAELRGFKVPNNNVMINNVINSERDKRINELRKRAHQANFNVVDIKVKKDDKVPEERQETDTD